MTETPITNCVVFIAETLSRDIEYTIIKETLDKFTLSELKKLWVKPTELIKCEFCDFKSEKESDFHWFSFPNTLESICDNCFQEKGRQIPKPIEEKPKPKPKPKSIKKSKPKPKPKPKSKFTNIFYPEGIIFPPPPPIGGDGT